MIFEQSLENVSCCTQMEHKARGYLNLQTTGTSREKKGGRPKAFSPLCKSSTPRSCANRDSFHIQTKENKKKLILQLRRVNRRPRSPANERGKGIKCLKTVESNRDVATINRIQWFQSYRAAKARVSRYFHPKHTPSSLQEARKKKKRSASTRREGRRRIGDAGRRGWSGEGEKKKEEGTVTDQ